MAAQGPSPALFFDTMSAYQRTEALRAAIELDVFSLVAAGRRTAAELAEACQAAPRGVRILADYLTILGFLRKHDDQYELTPDTEMFLNRQSPAYLGGAVDFLLTAEIRECFRRYGEPSFIRPQSSVFPRWPTPPRCWRPFPTRTASAPTSPKRSSTALATRWRSTNRTPLRSTLRQYRP